MVHFTSTFQNAWITFLSIHEIQELDVFGRYSCSRKVLGIHFMKEVHKEYQIFHIIKH